MKSIFKGFGSAFICLAIGISACKKKEEAVSVKPEATSTEKEPEHIKVQHILIGFEGTLPGKPIKRKQDEAKKLAEDILKKAQAGGDFDALVKENTDDRAPGIYGMSNLGVAPSGDEFPRDQMVPAFGDVGFKLKVGEVGMAEFSRDKSPYGYHVIKRIN